MPAIRQVTITSTDLSFIDYTGVQKTLSYVNISKSINTIPGMETYINNWLDTNKQPDYQMTCHVFSVNPLVCTIASFNLEEPIPNNWWLD